MEPYRVQHFDTVVSTNELVKHAIDRGEAEGLVCRAVEQVGGYGRQGRSWSSPRGGMYQSALLRPDVPSVQLPTVGLVMALSVRKALLSVAALLSGDVLVKWPNDVVCAEGKLAGISVEARNGAVCVGIGVNVWRPAVEQPVGGKNVPAYLVELSRNGLDRQDDSQFVVDYVGDAVMEAFWRRYHQWQREGFGAFVEEFSACNALAGRNVSVVDRNGDVVAAGPAIGVNADGCLLVGDKAVSSGEAHVL